MKYLRWIPFGTMSIISACSQNDQVNVADTRLCLPTRYLSTPNLYIQIATQGMPDSGEALIHIPAREVQDAIPAYVLSHSNPYTPTVMHDLRIVVSPSKLDFSQLEKEAWGVRAHGEVHFIEPDPHPGYTRIYLHFDSPAFMWQLALTPPPESTELDPPSGWYVAPCLEKPGSYVCTLLGRVGNLSLSFDVDERNMELRRDVIAYAEGRIQRWINACGV